MKTSRQIAFIVMQILVIATGFMYLLSYAADLINEKRDLLNVAGFGIIIAVIGCSIVLVAHYAAKFKTILVKDKPATGEPAP